MTLQVYDSDKLEDKEWGNFDRFGGKEYMLGYHKALSDIKNISREIVRMSC